MRFVFLCRDGGLFSVGRLIECARARGHVAETVDPYECLLTLEAGRPLLLYRGRPLGAVSCALPRLGANLSEHSLAVVRQLELMGVPTVNGSGPLALARDKLHTLQRLAGAGLPVVRTAFGPNPAFLAEALRRVGGPPVVFKFRRGMQGVGVMVAESLRAARALAEAMWASQQDVLIEEFVADSEGRDVRVLVVGGRIVGAMRRSAPAGDFRSNLHRGGQGEAVRLPRPHRELALRAAELVGLEVAGVDLLESRSGPKVLELNASPGFEGLERATGRDIAGAILRHAERRARGGAPRRSGRPR
ncbi:MAG: RimK family alpha-L-glutamate ligase [Nitrospinota bacterium]